jgi:hypothetical protein
MRETSASVSRLTNMRKFVLAVIAVIVPLFVIAQPQRPRPNPGATRRAAGAEAAIREAMQQLGAEKKIFERDLEVLAKLRAADQALIDTMQPSVSIQKAFEEVGAAKMQGADFVVMQGITRAEQELEAARRSPGTADFGRLRATLRREALGPASRVVVANALRLEDETLAWIKVQEMITSHQRALSEITSESLRAAER